MTDCTVQPGAVYRDTVDLRLLRIISVGLPAKWEEMALAELKQNTEARTEERDGETVVEEETNKQPLRQNILLSLTPSPYIVLGVFYTKVFCASLENMQGAFFVWGLGCLAACLGFCTELCISAKPAENHRRRRETFLGTNILK